MSNPTTTALALPMAFRPENLDQAITLAKKLADSHLLPKALQKQPEDVLVTLMAGHEFGLSPMQSIQAIDVIDGRPTMRAEMIVALVMKDPLCDYFIVVESTDKRAVYETKRKGNEPKKMEWTWEMAQRAGLVSKQNWAKYPDAMLRARCSSALARAVYPDVTRGLYASEEIRDEVELNPTPIPAAPAAPGAKAKTPEVVSTKPKAQAAKPAPAKPKPEEAQVEKPAEPAKVEPVKCPKCGADATIDGGGDILCAKCKDAFQVPKAQPESQPPAEERGGTTEPAESDGKQVNVDELFAEFSERIMACETVEDLKTLANGQIVKQPPEVQAALKKPYSDRLNEIRKATQA